MCGAVREDIGAMVGVVVVNGEAVAMREGIGETGGD